MKLLQELIARSLGFIDGMLMPRTVAEVVTERYGCSILFAFGVFMRLHIDCNNTCGVGRDEAP